MTDPKQELFFQSEIIDKLHEIVGVHPLEGQLSFRKDDTSNWDPFDTEVEYYIVERAFEHANEEFTMKKASICLGRNILGISKNLEDKGTK